MDNIVPIEHQDQKPLSEKIDTSNSSLETLQFAHHYAFIIGIDAYEKVSSLSTAVNDAKKVAEVLKDKHHFEVIPPLLDPKGSAIRTLLHDTMPKVVGNDDRVVFYFAGHGIASDGDDGPTGYIAPADADTADMKTFIPMTELKEALNNLTCRHLLVILDCCFAGAFKWTSGTRSIGSLMPKKIYKERFDRFIHDPAWEVITSAAYDQKAMDSITKDQSTGERGLIASESGENHSPFAFALFNALAGEADAKTGRESDGLITVTELYSYIRDQVEPATIEMGQQKRQTPGFFPLNKHDKGEFIFLHPYHRLNLPPRPARSPYKGLLSFEESDAPLFYGRADAIADLKSRLNSSRLLVLSGASGTGKSSLVKAGLLPWLRLQGHSILPTILPSVHPLSSLDTVWTSLEESKSNMAVLFIDHLEEVFTQCKDTSEQDAFLLRLRQIIDDTTRIHCTIMTVRSDYESRFAQSALKDVWPSALVTIPPFSLEQLMETAVMPTIQEVMIFDPPELIDSIIGEVVQSPGTISLLSSILHELYLSYIASGRPDRAMNQNDYAKLGGVMGILLKKADSLYQSMDASHQSVMRKIFLRMVSVQGDLAGKKLPVAELNYSGQENLFVSDVLGKLIDARLIVQDNNSIEPSHIDFVRSWKTLLDWIQQIGRDTLILGERLSQQADQYATSGNKQLLWNKNPNLANAVRLLKSPDHVFNAQEINFVRKSVARNQLRNRIVWTITSATIIALSLLAGWALIERSRAEEQKNRAEEQTKITQQEKNRAILSLFEGLNLNMIEGNPGSLCINGICDTPYEDEEEKEWQSLGELPAEKIPHTDSLQSTVFVASRQFGKGHIVAYAQDGLTKHSEIASNSDNLLFAQNALAWLTPLEQHVHCPAEIKIIVWEGRFSRIDMMPEVEDFIARRGWSLKSISQEALKTTSPDSIAKDLECAAVLWYLSNWDPPADFKQIHVPLIEKFVREGGGLLIGGLGWSYHDQYKKFYPNGKDTVYSGNVLGKPFGLSFTNDAFQFDPDAPLRLLQSN